MRPYPPDLVERDQVRRALRDRRSMMSWFEGVALTCAVIGAAAFIIGSVGWGLFGVAAAAFGIGCIWNEWSQIRKLRRQLEVLDRRIADAPEL